MFRSVLLVSLLCSIAFCRLEVLVSNEGNYSIEVDGRSWLYGHRAYFIDNGDVFDTQDGTLHLTNPIGGLSGYYRLTDGSVVFKWADDTGTVKMVTTISIEGSNVLFEQEFPLGFNSSRNPCEGDYLVSSFPAFEAPKSYDDDLGFYSFSGNHLGWKGISGRFNLDNIADVPTGLPAGPLILYDQNMTSALILSSASNFMIESSVSGRSSDHGYIDFGIDKSVKYVPSSFKSSFVVSVGNGVNDAVANWGIYLQKRYHTDRSLKRSDFILNHLGYSTDNGAYYYYKTEGDMNYEDTVLAVKRHVDDLGIPIKHILLDSWFYYKDSNKAVTNWTSMPSIFPHGLEYLHQKTGWKFQAHNRYWSALNVYSIDNGGNYKFLTEGGFALPLTTDFWNDFFYNASKWGLSAYEQDWLYVQLQDTPAMLNDVDTAQNWLIDMGKGALQNNITIQYCMSYHRHLLQTLEIPTVTQIRASEDYMAALDQWKIGTTSMLINALGLAPSKDSSWSTSVDPGAKHNNTEKKPELEAAIMTFSTGPVTFSDRINFFNKTLIMRSCALDGRILKPSAPMISIDAMFISRAFGTGGADGEVYTSHSSLGDLVWYHLLSGELASPYKFDFSKLCSDDHKFMRYSLFPVMENEIVAQDQYVQLDISEAESFELYHFAPVLTKNGFTFLGEVDKWVPVSPERFQYISKDETSITLLATGLQNEVMNLGVYMGHFISVSYVFPESGVLEFTIGESLFDSFTQ